MDSIIVLAYSCWVISTIIPGLLAIPAWTKGQAPLAIRFIRMNLSFTVFWGTLFATYSYLEGQPFEPLQGEVFFSTVYFLLYGALLITISQFFFELLQWKWEGYHKHTVIVLTVAAFVIPLGIHAIVFNGTDRAELLRSALNAIYLPAFLLAIMTLFIHCLANRKGITDEWKRQTLEGASWIFFCGIPFFLFDAFWPMTQVEWKLVPRGFNTHFVIVLVWNIFFSIKWLSFPLFGPIGVNASVEQDDRRVSSLTDRENAVFALLVAGKSNKEIATLLEITVGTTKNHIYNIFKKTGTSSRKELGNATSSIGRHRQDT